MTEYALRYTCGHYHNGANGRRLTGVPRGWHVKHIDAPCRQCSGPVLRLSLANRNKPYEDTPK